MEKRDAHIETLEKSLVQLSIEWYSMGEENKQFTAAHANMKEQRIKNVLNRLKTNAVVRAFNKWRHEVNFIAQVKTEETLDSAEDAIGQLQEELRATKMQTKVLERYVEVRRGRAVQMMLNLPTRRAFRTWASSITHTKMQTAARKANVQKEIADETKLQAKQAERDVTKLETEVVKYKGLVMEHRQKAMAAIVKKMCFAGIVPAFSTWKHHVHRRQILQHVDQRLSLEEHVQRQKETVLRVQRVLHKAQAGAVRKMRNAGYVGAWTKWCEYVRDARLSAAVAESAFHQEENVELESERTRMWGIVKTMGLRMVRKTFKECESRYFDKWRAGAQMGRLLQYDRAVRTMVNLVRAKAFRHWRDMVSDKVEHEQHAEQLQEHQQESEDYARDATERLGGLGEEIVALQSECDYWQSLANSTLSKLRGTADKALKRMYFGAAYNALKHWHRVVRMDKRHGHIQAVVDRAKSRGLERLVNGLLVPSFTKWKLNVAAKNLRQAEEEADESDRLLLEARDDARRWRDAAERGWAAVQRMGHRALRRMINAHLWRTFGHWRKVAQGSVALKSCRRTAEARIEALERKLHPLEGEVGALRLFRDAMASSERTMLMRKGGGFIALEEYVATVENRISAAALEGALEGKPRGEEMAARYGLSSALDALRGAAQATHGEVQSPRGGFTSWKHAPQMAKGSGPGNPGGAPCPGTSGRRHRPGAGGRRGSAFDGSGGGFTSNGGRQLSGAQPIAGNRKGRDDGSDSDRDFGHYEPRTTAEAQFGGGGGLAHRSYGPGHSTGGQQRVYEAPAHPNDVSLRVTYKATYGSRPDEREPLEGDHDRLGAVGGIGAGAVNRKKLLKGKIAIDVERAQRLATRSMSLAYDPPAPPRLERAVRDVYDDAAGGAAGGGVMTDRSDAGSWRSSRSAPLDSARSGRSDTANVAPPIGFSDVGSLKGVGRSRNAVDAMHARDVENRRKTAGAWNPDALDDGSDSDEAIADTMLVRRWSESGESSSEDGEIDGDKDERVRREMRGDGALAGGEDSTLPSKKREAASTGIAGVAKVSGRRVQDPLGGWNVTSGDRPKTGTMTNGGDSTDDDSEYALGNKNI